MQKMQSRGIEEEEQEHERYDRAKEVKLFDNSKIGVKGLVDSGITSIPRFFIHPDSSDSLPTTTSVAAPRVPTVDLTGVNSDRRSSIVDQIRDASCTLGFFQVVNHGIPLEVLDRTIAAAMAFHDQPTPIKALHYTRDMARRVSFCSNFDLLRSKAATWRDSFIIKWDPDFDTGEIPEICRSEFVEWDRHIQRLGETLMEILSEGLGVESGRLKALSFTEGKRTLANYYPHCPEPDRTYGFQSHTDAAALTVLLQDQIGGLQVKHGDQWLDVPPLRGAFVVNIGDVLQIISNETYKSVEHRVLANNLHKPRISVGAFFNPSKREDSYGPLPELISPDKPALYRSFTLLEFLTMFLKTDFGDKPLIKYFRL